MPRRSTRDTPRRRIEAECTRRGKVQVVEGCVTLLDGGTVDPALLRALAGQAADPFLQQGGREDEYWLRVWGARGLLWAWDDLALMALQRATRDDAWRVREMAAKVVARNLLGDAVPDVAKLVDDPVPRVRTAASRALVCCADAGL